MDKNLKILACLRSNARMPLTRLARKTGLPVSTIFDRIKQAKSIQRHSTLINFHTLGFTARALVLVRVNKKNKESLQGYLTTHPNINTLSKINNGYDYLFECVFRTMYSLENFLEQLDDAYELKQKTVHYIVNEIKRESFLSNPEDCEQLEEE